MAGSRDNRIGMDLDHLIADFRGPLVGLLAAWGASPAEALELAADSFAEAYLSRARFEGSWEDPAAAGAWLRGIAHKLFHASQRKRGRMQSLDAAGREVHAKASGAPGSLERLERDEEAERLHAAMAELSGPHRTVLLMRYVEGSSLACIGALLGLSARAVEGRLRRARAVLKAKLEAGMTQEGRK